MEGIQLFLGLRKIIWSFQNTHIYAKSIKKRGHSQSVQVNMAYYL
eukprot:UN01542